MKKLNYCFVVKLPHRLSLELTFGKPVVVYKVEGSDSISYVAKVEYEPRYRSVGRPKFQWLVWFNDGSLWFSFGKTRSDAVARAERDAR